MQVQCKVCIDNQYIVCTLHELWQKLNNEFQIMKYMMYKKISLDKSGKEIDMLYMYVQL